MPFSKIEHAIAAIGRGEMIVVVDAADRENEGDLLVAADAATPQVIAFMMKHARGLICAPLPAERLDALDIPLMVARNTESMQTAFTVSVDIIEDATTGISAADRAATVRRLVDPRARPSDFARPGHIFPLRAHAGGVLGRPGHTESAVDFARLSGRGEGGVICEICNDDGTMARLPELVAFAREHGLHLVTIADLVDYRRALEVAPSAKASTRRPVSHADVRA
ncbi:3,4-dihydroxy-2-butanone-4-phosphate synthase [Rhizobium sp. CF142]|uniref:3,4-dihydroxy-2-butanone-4-phosphate synthase n=1 Tax=Rhizobium sp. CF142 TaxID=1144314 RepID=UPI00026EEC23|nr:3,4-dihydroxy-2-butanone-4-phosphate synthase [Rhizobium sp. CF142]EJJ26702.1 3,4-dihydroxy-2-butanone 4-phosphate synthase [Rhizobium sp. CF142]